MRVLFVFSLLGFPLTACTNLSLEISGNQSLKPVQLHSQTLTEELIEQERISYSVKTSIDTPGLHDQARRKYDEIIDDAIRAFAKEAIDIEKARTDRAEAIRALETIESVFVENHFMLFIKTSGLHETLIPKPPKLTRFLTTERRIFYEAHPDDLYHHFDCDLGSLVILGIAERMGLPISFVEKYPTIISFAGALKMGLMLIGIQMLLAFILISNLDWGTLLHTDELSIERLKNV